jgi:RHS repeat-associated protein
MPLSTSAYGNRFLFQGREYFTEFHLNDHRNRYYSPLLQRWLNRDPIGEVIEGEYIEVPVVNPLYQFCLNDAVNCIDSSGLKCLVTYKCVYLSEETSKGIKACTYSCVEDTTKQRQTAAGGETDCSNLDKQMRRPHKARWIRSTPAWCDCAKTYDNVVIGYDAAYNPITNCSQRECLDSLKKEIDKLKAVCNLLKGPAKTICNGTVQSIEVAGNAACRACTKP